MERIIHGNDVYFIQVVGNKIVINNNYEGIIVYDYGINKIKEIQLFEDICIYSSFISENNDLILYCPENDKIVFLNIEHKETKILDIPSNLENEIIQKIVRNIEDKYIFSTFNQNYICLDKKECKVRMIANDSSIINQLVLQDNKDKYDDINNILQTHRDCNNSEVKDDISAITYDDRILVYENEKLKKEIVPKKSYFFNNSKLLIDGLSKLLVVLSNNLEDEEISVISVLSI